MFLEIKKVKRCKNNAYGNFLIRGRESAVITISLQKNKLLSEYGATLLHELLHCYTSLLRREGYRTTNKREHRWIEDCEVEIVRLMQKHLTRRK